MCSRAARPAELRGALGPLPRQLGAQRLIVERALERGGERRHIAASGMKRVESLTSDAVGKGAISREAAAAALRNVTATSGWGPLAGADVATKSGSRFFAELKLGFGDSPDMKAVAGWSFKPH